MDEIRDKITIRDEDGEEKEYSVEALFHMNEQSYALLRWQEETLVMRIEEEDGQQYLVGLDDEEETNSLLDAYEIAVAAEPQFEDGDLRH